MKIDLQLESFNGPLDLLLHLIEKNKIDIYDIPIVEITDQYIECMRDLERVESMETMSDFLVMASTLLRIKSMMLLPHDEESEEEDPREELVLRLMEYKMYKYAAGELKDMSVEAARIFYKEESVPEEIRSYQPPVDPMEVVGDVSMKQLSDVFKMVMARMKDRENPVAKRFGRITHERYKVEDRMGDIRRRIHEAGEISFARMISERNDRDYCIASFLAVLELLKLGEIVVEQKENFADISVYARGSNTESA